MSLCPFPPESFFQVTKLPVPSRWMEILLRDFIVKVESFMAMEVPFSSAINV